MVRLGSTGRDHRVMHDSMIDIHIARVVCQNTGRAMTLDGTLDVPHDWSIEDLPGAVSDQGGATANPSNSWVPPGTTPLASAPPLIGPFDVKNSPGQAATGYTIGGEGWYRKHFRLDPAAIGLRCVGEASSLCPLSKTQSEDASPTPSGQGRTGGPF